MLIHNHHLVLARAHDPRPKRRRLLHRLAAPPPHPAIPQPLGENHLHGRAPRPIARLGVLIRHEHDRQAVPTRGDLRRAGIPPGARAEHLAAIPPRPPPVPRHRVLDAEQRRAPRRLEHHDQRLAPGSSVPHRHDALHPVAQALVRGVAAQAARRLRAPGGPPVAGVHAEGLLVGGRELGAEGELDCARGAEPHCEKRESITAMLG
ncbi:hypothetical protein F4810DRAFT_670796, partial [Camillea tinctor]